jgi:ketosteroid isomerase-like protein
MKNSEETSFEVFMKEREAAAQAYVRGDAAPLRRVTTQVSPATFFGPKGGDTRGASEVFSRYEGDAKGFAPEGQSSFEILHLAASDGVAYWVGYQHAMAHLRGKSEAVPMKLRVTELFRREGDQWKLVHRHADSLAEATA